MPHRSANLSSFADTRLSSKRNTLFLLTVVVALGCAGLGGWQLSRLFQRRARNALALSQRDLPSVDLNQSALTGPVGRRRVTVAGSYDFEREFVIRGRLYQGTPGIQIVTPLRPTGRDTAILVTRGFVPSPDAGRLPSVERYREEATGAVAGIAMAAPNDGDGLPLATPLGETWRRIDLTAMRARLPYPVAEYYVIAQPDTLTAEHTIRSRQFPIRIEPPPLDDGPHLSYAVQWFLIGASVIGFGIVFVRRRRETPEVPPGPDRDRRSA